MKKPCFKSLMIEPTNICNLHCPVCPTSNKGLKRPKGFMNFQQFKAIIDQVKNFLEYINLWNYGEPFLAPDIIRMIHYTGENNILVNIHTNGSVLSRKMMDQFKKNYRINISFSIDGLTQETYSCYRVGGSLEKVLGNLSYLIGLKKKYNLFNLQIIWQFLIMKTNEHEVNKVFETAKKIGVDKLMLKTIGVNKEHPKYDNFMPKNKKYQREREERDKNINFSECFFVNPGIPTILLNGNVVPCCVDWAGQNFMGNIFEENLLDIWNNQKYRKFRKDYKNGQNVFCNSKCQWDKNLIYVKKFNF